MKRSLLVEAGGGPLGLAAAGANVHDAKLLEATLEAVVAERPAPSAAAPQHLALDKGYDNPSGEEAARLPGDVPHIRRIGEPAVPREARTHPPRRWVVERTLAWLSTCRGLLVRYEKRAANFVALLKLACALLWYRRLHRLSLLG